MALLFFVLLCWRYFLSLCVFGCFLLFLSAIALGKMNNNNNNVTTVQCFSCDYFII